MRIAIYPGTFDPITNGHLDIVARAGHLFDKVIVLIVENPNKRPIFTVAQRSNLIREAVRAFDHSEIAVDSFQGLTIDYARQAGAQAIVRGLRVLTDFEWEFQLALINHKLAPEIETVCLMAAQEHSFLSASVVRELAQHDRADLLDLVPAHVAAALRAVYRQGRPVPAGTTDRSDV